MQSKQMAKRGSPGGNTNKGSSLAKTSTLSSTGFFNALNKYIPSLVLQNWVDMQLEQQALEKLQKQLSNPVMLKELEEEIQKQRMERIEQFKAQINLRKNLPFIQELETVVLFADISGFTKVSEACAKMGMRGNEELAFCINRYMEGMVKNLSKFGGDIIKFVGDAMIVMWPRKSQRAFKNMDDDGSSNVDEDDEKSNVIRKAIQCAFDIQREMDNKKIMANVTGLSVKIGIAYGKCALLYVGGIFDRSEIFTVGPALTCALESEGCATQGGQIIVCHTAYKPVEQYYEGKYVNTVRVMDKDYRFYQVMKVNTGIRGSATAVLMKTQIKQDMINQMMPSLKMCVPNAIMPCLEIGFESYGSEIRTLTVMFASLGVDLSDSATNEGRAKIQRIITCVQQQVYKLEGSLNKLVMDDKGSTLICIWGVSPLAHVDDPERAILCAINMRRELYKIDKTGCNIGIATGDVFSGVVGTSGSRKEFSVLGDTVNLAARIMFWPIKHKKVGKINCDLRTKNEALRSVQFKYGGHCEFKGKSLSIPIFAPIDPFDEYPLNYLSGHGSGNRIVPPQCYLKLNHNPILTKLEVDPKRDESPLIGKQAFVGRIYDEIKTFFLGSPIQMLSSPMKHQSVLVPKMEAKTKQPLSMILTGDKGSGKTHCVRKLVEKLQKDQELIQVQQVTNLNLNYKEDLSKEYSTLVSQGSKTKLPIFSTAPNVETTKQFLGSWRPIFRSMFEFKRKQLNMTVEELLGTIIQGHDDLVDLLLKLFGFYPYVEHCERFDDIYHKQMQNYQRLKSKLITDNYSEDHMAQPILDKNNKAWFLMREKYSDAVTTEVLEICLDFIMFFLGEQQYDVESQSSQDESALSARKSRFSRAFNSQNAITKEIKQMCMLIFDNATILEEESFSLLLRVYEECENIVMIMIVDQDHKSLPIMPTLEAIKQLKESEKQKIQVPQYCIDDHRILKEFMIKAKVIDVPSLSVKDLRQILVGLAHEMSSSWIQEIAKIIEIVDPKNTIKTIEMGEDWKKRLYKTYQLDRIYTKIEDRVLRHIVQKCTGVPLMSLEYFLVLLTSEFLSIDKTGEVVATRKLEECIHLDNFTKIYVPNSAHKRRLKNQDDFLKRGRIKAKSKAWQSELYVKGIILLKAASVIGDEFGTSALKRIIPLRQETHASLINILKELELNDFIEILDESDPKDVRCRFNQTFLRESLYQVMLFKDQKQVLHRQLAEHIQSLPTPVMEKSQIELQLQKLEQHVMIGEDITDMTELPFKQMHGLVVKKMQYKLVNQGNKSMMHMATVYKQGKSANKTISERLLVLYPREIRWYHDKKEMEKSLPPLGIIFIGDIYKTSETLMQAKTFDFDISFVKYIKKGENIDKPNHINFGCRSAAQRHEWISMIEFLRANTIYEEYVNKYVNIQFPLRQEDKYEEGDEDTQAQDDAILEKLNTFAKNFKQNATIALAKIPQQQMMTIQNQNLSQLSRHKTFRKGGTKGSVQGGFDLIRRGSISKYSEMDIDSVSTGGSPKLTKEDIKYRLKSLYQASVVGFFVQTQAHSNKQMYSNIKNKPIGRLPDFFKTNRENLAYNSQQRGVETARKKSYLSSGTRPVDLSPNELVKSSDRNKSQQESNSTQHMGNIAEASEKSSTSQDKRSSSHEPLIDRMKQPLDLSKKDNSLKERRSGPSATPEQMKNLKTLQTQNNKKRDLSADRPLTSAAVKKSSEQTSGGTSQITHQLAMLDERQSKKKAEERKESDSPELPGRSFTFSQQKQQKHAVKKSQPEIPKGLGGLNMGSRENLHRLDALSSIDGAHQTGFISENQQPIDAYNMVNMTVQNQGHQRLESKGQQSAFESIFSKSLMNELMPAVSQRIGHSKEQDRKAQKMLKKVISQVFDERIAQMQQQNREYDDYSQASEAKNSRRNPHVFLNSSVSSKSRKQLPNTGIAFGRSQHDKKESQHHLEPEFGESDSVEDPEDPEENTFSREAVFKAPKKQFTTDRALRNNTAVELSASRAQRKAETQQYLTGNPTSFTPEMKQGNAHRLHGKHIKSAKMVGFGTGSPYN